MAANVTVEEHDMGWREIQRQLKIFKNGITTIGYWSRGGGPDVDLAARAIVNELGAEKNGKQVIVPRPFMRQTFDNNKKKIWSQITKEYNNVLAGKFTARQALSRLGEWYTGLVKITITKGKFAPNRPATRARKRGSTKPLIDTGQMRNSVDHRENK